MVKLRELRKNVYRVFLENRIDEAAADCDFLLYYLTGADKGELLLGEREVDLKTEETVLAAAKRRINGEPVQYITERCEFFGREFKVSPKTLIPRADTEILVQAAAEIIKKNNLKSFLDIGTGSGCIGLSLLAEEEGLCGSLLDISEGALKVSRFNAEALKVEKRAKFIKTDILAAKKEDFSPFDIIVSNPPYIERETVKTLDEKVRCFEPMAALDGGEDGLCFYRKITELASSLCRYLAFEIGYNQGEAVYEIMSEYFSDIELIRDYGGNNRVLTGKNKQI